MVIRHYFKLQKFKINICKALMIVLLILIKFFRYFENLKNKNELAMTRFCFLTKAFVSIEISPIFMMLIPTLRGNITQATHTLLKSTLSKPHNF